MKYKDEINQIVTGEVKFITSDHPHINNLEFLQELEQTYADMQHYEVASIIKDRITILGANESAQKALDDLNNKIKLYKNINNE